jgi:hypothetical protein
MLLSVTHYHPQWFLWVTPFLIWGLVEKMGKYLEVIIILIVSWLIITLFFEPSLSLGLFGPISPLLAKAPGLTDVLAKYTDVAQIKSIVRSIFAAASLFYTWQIIKEEK